MLEQGDIAFAMEADSDDEDAEDDEIHPTDALLVVAMTEDEFSHLEVQLLAEDGNMFVHHDIQLPEFPLCLAWLDCPPFLSAGEQQAVGNYMAVGSFNPAIEIWNLDVLDPLEPTAVLGGEVDDTAELRGKQGKQGKKGKKGDKGRQGPALKDGSHVDAVMSLSWNKVYRQALASGSADMTVKIWDVTTQKCSHTFRHHRDKVQCVLFHPDDAWLLATGAFDKSIALLDCRSGSTSATYAVPADMESMTWDPFQANHLYTALEDGTIICIDRRQADRPLFSFRAHEATCSSLSFSSSVPGFLCTASVDQTVKAWDMAACQTGAAGAPVEVAYKSMMVGKLFTLQFFPDNPFLLATGGDAGLVAVWESDEMDAIQKRFGGRVTPRENAYLAMSGGGGGGGGGGSAVDGGVARTESSAAFGGGIKTEDDAWMDEPSGENPPVGAKVGKKNKEKKQDRKKKPFKSL